MGLEDAGPQLGRIDPSSLIGRADEDVVSPRATAALADAFRQGFVSVDDIMERVGERAQLKKKADIMQLQESMTPLAIEARKNQLELANIEAQAGIDLSPMKKKAAEAEFGSKWANAQINTSGLAPQAAELQNAGWLPPIPPKGIDNKWQEEVIRRWGDLQESKHALSQNAAFLQEAQKNTTLKEISPGEWQGVINFGGKVYDGNAFKQASDFQRKFGGHPALWAQAGKPQSPIFGGPPGQVETAPAKAAGETKAPAGEGQAAVASAPGSTALAPGSSQPIINVNFGGQPVGTTKPNVMVADAPMAPMIDVAPEVVQPLVPPVGAAAKPVITPGPLGVTPEGTLRVAPEMAKAARPLTEVQTRAFQEAVRAAEAAPVFDSLKSKGFNPADSAAATRIAIAGDSEARRAALGIAQNVAEKVLPKSMTPQVRLTPDEQQYVSARESWLTGVLRKESGAAIGEQERDRYIVQFFPVEGDTQAVQDQKAVRRKAVEMAARAVVHDKTMTPAEYETLWSTIGMQSTQQLQKGAAAAPSATIPSFSSPQEAIKSGARDFYLNGKRYTK